jgi:hypothetical protein
MVREAKNKTAYNRILDEGKVKHSAIGLNRSLMPPDSICYGQRVTSPTFQAAFWFPLMQGLSQVPTVDG